MDPKLVEAATEFLIATPVAMVFLVLAFLSGHLWIFILLTYAKSTSRGNRKIDNTYGKIALGIAWLAIVLLPVYYCRNHSLDFQPELILDVLPSTMIYALCIQLPAFWVIATLFRER